MISRATNRVRKALLSTKVTYYGRPVDADVLWTTTRGRWVLLLAWVGNFFSRRAERNVVAIYAARYGLSDAIPELLRKYDNERHGSPLAAFGITTASYSLARVNTVSEASKVSAEALNRFSHGPQKSGYTSSREEVKIHEVEDQELITA